MPVNNPPLAANFCACAPRQETQLNLFGENIRANRSLGNVGFLQFLLSPRNKGAITITEAISAGNGKSRVVQIMSDVPICPAFCSSPINCATTYASQSGGIECIDFSLSTPFHLCTTTGGPTPTTTQGAWTFDKIQWLKYCNLDDDIVLQRQFAKVNDQLIKYVDGQLAQQLKSLISPSQKKQVPFFINNTTTGQPVLNPQAMFAISKFERDGGYDGDYVLMGGELALQLQQHLRVASASQAGYDVTKDSANYPPIYYDRNFDTHFPNSIVAIPWQSIQLITFNDYIGNRAVEVPNLYKRSTLAVSLGNGSTAVIDYRWEFDYNCEVYKYDPRMYGELFVAPKGGCGIDPDFNGIIEIVNCGPSYAVECPPAVTVTL